MDSFLSLFGPSDDESSKTIHKNKEKIGQDTVKKKTDPPKGRRKNRRSQSKNETLPEESSFLCEPEICSELLVKDASYVDSYIQLLSNGDDLENKPKRRNSYRKNRRKKNRISPEKDDVPTQIWGNKDSEIVKDEKTDDVFTDKWNNKFVKPKISDDNTNIGKNVNDLSDYRKNKSFSKDYDLNDFQKMSYKEYLTVEELRNFDINDDIFSDEDLGDDDDDDDDSDDDDTSQSGLGRLPPEPRFGNVEYKLQLVAPSETRLQHLVTQLKWRLGLGGGRCVYVVGVRDCGVACGVTKKRLARSVRTVREMCRQLCLVATARVYSASSRALAEIYIRQLDDPQQSVELRVAVMGANEAGKSTLIGVLTQGELDNGRGSARLNMFRHLHEVKSGRTSSLSHEILGFDAQGNVVNYGGSSLMTAARIGERAARLVAFLDLCGHSRYQRTTRLGLTGYSPHHAALTISATQGITLITEEHLELACALHLPMMVVITKCDLSVNALPTLLVRLTALLQRYNRKPILITDEESARECAASQKAAIAIPDGIQDITCAQTVPVFPVSCVRGKGLNFLQAYLLALPTPPGPNGSDLDTCEFQIDERFHTNNEQGPIVGGMLVRGTLREGDVVLIGPLENGDFVPISVKSIYRNKVPCGVVRANQPASLGLCLDTGLKTNDIFTYDKFYDINEVQTVNTKKVIDEDVELSNNKEVFNKDDQTKSDSDENHNDRKDVSIKKQSTDELETSSRSSANNNYLFEDDDDDDENKDTDDSDDNHEKIIKRKSNLIIKQNKLNNLTTDSDSAFESSSTSKKHADVKSMTDNFTNIKDKEFPFKVRPGMVLLTLPKTKKNSKTEEKDEKKSHVTEILKKCITVDKSKNKKNVRRKNKRSSTVDEENKVDIEDQKQDKDKFEDGKSIEESDDENFFCDDKPVTIDPFDPRGCFYFQAKVHLLRHSGGIYPGFQCTVHIGNVRQTAVIEGVLGRGGCLQAGTQSSALFRLLRRPEYLRAGATALFTQGAKTRAIGRITQVFPHVAK